MNRKSILQIEPELLGSPEILGQTGGHLGSNSPLLPNNVVDGGRRNTKFYRQPVSGDAHRLQKLLPKNFSRMNCPTRWTLIFDTHDCFSYSRFSGNPLSPRRNAGIHSFARLFE